MQLNGLFDIQRGSQIAQEDRDEVFSLMKRGLFRKDIAERVLLGIRDFLLIDASFGSSKSIKIVIRREDGSSGPAFIVQRTEKKVSVIFHDQRRTSSNEVFFS